jgi:hypothetical protein
MSDVALHRRLLRPAFFAWRRLAQCTAAMPTARDAIVQLGDRES